MKKYLLLSLAVLFIYASSCKKEEDVVVSFDHAAQAVIDNDSLVSYFKTHFINSDGDIEEIENGETSIFASGSLKSKTVTYSRGGEEIDYTLYFYRLQNGIDGVETTPTPVDIVNISYIGRTLEDDEIFDRVDDGILFDLYSDVIVGMREGVIEFKAGDFVHNESEDTYTYMNNGIGYFFLPSGLAYANVGTGSISANTPIYFKIALNRVFHEVDHDGDGIYSYFEVSDGEYYDYDTDEDGIPNFRDSDDDGDGTLTIYENPDPNGDGDPADAENSSNDDNPNVPDYLDPNVPSK